MEDPKPTPPAPRVTLDTLTALHAILNQCSLLASPARHVEEGSDLLTLLKRSSEAVMKLSKRLHGEKQYPKPQHPVAAAIRVFRGEDPMVAARRLAREREEQSEATRRALESNAQRGEPNGRR